MLSRAINYLTPKNPSCYCIYLFSRNYGTIKLQKKHLIFTGVSTNPYQSVLCLVALQFVNQNDQPTAKKSYKKIPYLSFQAKLLLNYKKKLEKTAFDFYRNFDRESVSVNVALLSFTVADGWDSVKFLSQKLARTVDWRWTATELKSSKVATVDYRLQILIRFDEADTWTNARSIVRFRWRTHRVRDVETRVLIDLWGTVRTWDLWLAHVVHRTDDVGLEMCWCTRYGSKADTCTTVVRCQTGREYG